MVFGLLAAESGSLFVDRLGLGWIGYIDWVGNVLLGLGGCEGLVVGEGEGEHEVCVGIRVCDWAWEDELGVVNGDACTKGGMKGTKNVKEQMDSYDSVG